MTGYLPGTTATLLVTFYAYPGGPAVDVTGLTITITPTGGGAAVLGPTSAGIVAEVTGTYSYAWAIDASADAGTYIVSWDADGPVEATEAVTVAAAGTGWAPDYCTPAQLKAYARIADDHDDAEVALAITSASRVVDQHCGRQFGAVAAAEQRFYTACWDRRILRWMVDVDDFAGEAAVTYAGVALTDVDRRPFNAAAAGRPYTLLEVGPDEPVTLTSAPDLVAVTALWGWAAVPGAVVQATMLQASRILSRRESPHGISGSPDTGGELRLLARLDADVAVILGAYRRRWWAR